MRRRGEGGDCVGEALLFAECVGEAFVQRVFGGCEAVVEIEAEVPYLCGEAVGGCWVCGFGFRDGGGAAGFRGGGREGVGGVDWFFVWELRSVSKGAVDGREWWVALHLLRRRCLCECLSWVEGCGCAGGGYEEGGPP